MPDATLPLDDLTRQIAERQSELERLRQEYEARQARLADLNRRQEELQSLLRQVQAEMKAVSAGSSPALAAPPAEPGPSPSASPANTPARPRLADALVEVAREAGRPLTAREMGEALVRRKYPTTSGNMTARVQNRLTDLLKRGIFLRAAGQRGFVLGAAADSTKPTASKAARGAAGPAKEAAPGKAAARKTTPVKQAAPPSRPGLRTGQPSLRSLLTGLLQKSRKPVAARVLAEQVLATGYQTNSKNFTDVVWTALGQLEGAESVEGQGWRLKKR